MLENDLAAVRKRFLTDFEFWAKHCCVIRTKQGTIVPLVLNRVQKRFLKAILDQLMTTGRVRIVTLKARQQGVSTVIHAVCYWWLSQHRAHKHLVMAHEAESTQSLFDMYRRTHDNVPEMLRPSTKYSSRTELVFDQLDTALRVATAGGRGVARGETLQLTHLSEVAFWPEAFAENNFNGLIQAVPEIDNTFVFIESTANGIEGKFAEIWDGAVKGENGYYPFFAGWYETDEYAEPAPADFERTPAEEDLAQQYNLTNDQLFWRRRKIAANGLDLFHQEYPAYPDEAFLSTGRPVFNPDYIMERLREPKKPLALMAVEGRGSIELHPRGELKVYYDVDPSETYTIGADVGAGVGTGRTVLDYSVAQVLDSKLRQVAVWRGVVQPHYFAKVLEALGYYYNTAAIAPERNNHGILTCVRLRDFGYPNIWTDEKEGALDTTDTILIGFLTNERTKPLIIDKLRAVDRAREIEINDEDTLREMRSFVVKDNGKMEAQTKKLHDDCVMALAIANHIHEGRWTPVQVPDELYVHGI